VNKISQPFEASTMADDPQKQTILVSDFVEYLNKKLSKFSCSACDWNGYSPVSLPDNTTAGQMHLHVGMGYIPSLAIICNNCGHIRLFYWQTVYSWIQERAQKNG